MNLSKHFPTITKAWRRLTGSNRRGLAELVGGNAQDREWILNGLTIDGDILQNKARLVQYCRDAFIENPYLRKFKDDAISNVHGSKGITLQSKVTEEGDRVVFSSDEKAFLDAKRRDRAELVKRGKRFGIKFREREFYRELSTDLERAMEDRKGNRAKATVKAGQPDVFANTLIEREWKAWQKSCDITGKRNWRSICNLLLFQMIRDGAVFIWFHIGKNVNKWGFAVQIINDEWVDHTVNREAQFDLQGRKTANKIRLGIEEDDKGKTVAYYVLKRRPNDWQYVNMRWGCGSYPAHEPGTDHERVPAEEMIHYAVLEEDAEQTRGTPAISTALQKLRHLDKYEVAEVVSARAEACKGGHYEATVPGMDPEALADKIERNGEQLTQNVEPAMWKTVPFGWTAKAHDPTHPNGNFETFRKAMLRAICSGLPGGAYSRIGNDYESVNFSSSRAESLNVNELWMMLQESFIDIVQRPVFEEFLRYSLTWGAINLPLQKFEKFNKPMFQGRRWQWVDPLKEAQASAMRVANNQTSEMRVCNEQGNDFEEIVEERAIARLILLEAGLNPDPQIGKTNPTQKPEPEDEPDDEEDDDEGEFSTNGNGNGKHHLAPSRL